MNWVPIHYVVELNLHLGEFYKVCFLIPGVLQNSLVLVLLVFLITVLFCSCAPSKDCSHEAKQIDNKPDYLL